MLPIVGFMKNFLLDMNAPKAPIRSKVLEIHGDQRIDPYFWLNDRNDPEVIAYLDAENEYREQVMASLKPLEDKLFKEIVGRIKQTDMSVPYKQNGYWYLTQLTEGHEYPVYLRRKDDLNAVDEILLDVNRLAQSYAYYHVQSLSVSKNNEWLAYGEDTVSRRIYSIRFRNLITGEILEECIPGTTGQPVWANDNLTVFYTTKDETLRAFKVFKHKLGTSPDKDVLVYHEEDETFNTYIYKTRSKEFLMIGSHQTVSSEFRFVRADTPDEPFQLVQSRMRDLEYTVDHYHDHFYIRTNWQAKNFQLVSTPVSHPDMTHWKTIIPNRPDVLFEGLTLFKHFMVLEERINGINTLRVRQWDGGNDHYIEFGEEAYVASAGINPDLDAEVMRIGYTSPTTPNSTFEYAMGARTLKLLKQEEVVGVFDKEHYVSERHFALSSDGSKIPISLVYKKGFLQNGQQPLLLYGYGSYGFSIEPYFSSPRLSLLDRGFTFAIAHIRGGEEMGRIWYEEGKLLNKKNTFTDFIDCAQYLIDKNYTNPQNLFALGGSAGGLLIGAVINMRPDLWRGVIAAVPFVDVVTTMLDTSIPLTTGEFDEWGNPIDPVFYEYMKSYSPYDNVARKDYPAMLVTTGLHDSQVQYWEPAKWVAKLRVYKTDANPLLFFCNMETGHGGASGRFQRHKETAMEYAFLLGLLGIKE
jgi:oligopeptidase B